MFLFIRITALFLLILSVLNTSGQTGEVKHIKVYHEPGRYAAWPANTGIWQWGDEILTGFSIGYHKPSEKSIHFIDREKTEIHVLARSKDGGETWQVEDPAKDGVLVFEAEFGTQRKDFLIPQPKVLKDPINFKDPNLAIVVRFTKDKKSYFWHSNDKGKKWDGPFQLPDFGMTGLEARTDYIINSEKECMLFLTASKSDGKEGKVICVKTSDGGLTWSLVSPIGEEPAGFAIMPSAVRISKNQLLTTIRNRENGLDYISTYYSKNNGKTWKQLDNAADDTGKGGSPPAMVRLKDGRICMVYAYRADAASGKNAAIIAKLSSDNGKSWSDPYVLRNDGAARDVGYPKMVQRPDGKVVIVYYFTDLKTGPERYIDATIWDVPKK
jgi:photosystem II stability/assembly factor-like uncharacterized protein